ncbi:MAG: D-alanyl-D-alanine carboxypeptidase family protein, partial [Alphaproteobacteria bacterium]
MTAYLTLEAVDEGRLSLKDQLTVSEAAADQPERKAYLAPGSKLSLEAALLATVVHSANDTAVVLAEAVAGSEAAFVDRMNGAAERIGMHGTHFTNASGLPDPAARITARDAALLAQETLSRFPKHADMFSRRFAQIGSRRLATSNGLLDSVPGAIGMKTGFTCWSGYNVILAAERAGRTLITVVLGGSTSGARNREAANLIDAAFRSRIDDIDRSPLAMAQPAIATAGETPPHVLDPGTCDAAIAAAETGQPSKGRLPGWGVLFGAFPTTKEANARIASTLKLLPPAQRRGRPTIVPSTRRPILLHNALLTGLAQQDVIAICGSLNAQKVFCQGLPPNILTEPLAVWR